MKNSNFPRLQRFTFSLVLSTGLSMAAHAETLRPPAVPLVTFDPYLSIWSEADKLTDKNTQNSTHRDLLLVSLIRIDGKAYRLMGTEPANVPPLAQVTFQVLPTRNIYEFEPSGVHVTP